MLLLMIRRKKYLSTPFYKKASKLLLGDATAGEFFGGRSIG